jgi:hypothetical protein
LRSNSQFIKSNKLTGALIVENPEVTPTDVRFSTIYFVGNGQTTNTTNNSEMQLQVSGPASLGSNDGPVMAMRGNVFTRQSNQRGAIIFQAGSNISSPVGLDGSVQFSAQNGYLSFSTNNLERLAISNAGVSTFTGRINGGRIAVTDSITTTSSMTVGGNFTATGDVSANDSLKVNKSITLNDNIIIAWPGGASDKIVSFRNSDTYRQGLLMSDSRVMRVFSTGASGDGGIIAFNTRAATASGATDYGTERARITADGEALFGTTSDAGDYRVQIAGGLYNTTNAALAVSSGSVTVGTTSTANYKLNVEGNTRILSSDTTGTLVVRGKPDVPNIGGSPGFGGGYVVFAENAASGYANLQIGGLSNSPYSIYIQANNGSVVQDISMQPLGGNVGIGTLASAPSEKLHVIGNGLFSGSIKTGAPAGGTAATWKLGIVVAGSYTAASNYLQVDVGGTLYYIGLVTPN